MGIFRSADGGVSKDRAVIPLEQALTGIATERRYEYELNSMVE